MYARVTTYQADPGRLKELTDKLPQIKDKVADLEGVVDWYVVWRADGEGTVLTVFEDKAAADASVTAVQGIWRELMGLLKVPPKAENFDNVETLDD